MQDLAKTMISTSIGVGMLGVKTMTQMASPTSSGDAVRSVQHFLDDVNHIAASSLGPEWRKAFDYGDEIQRRVIDAGMGAVGANLTNPEQVVKMSQDAFQFMKIFLPDPGGK